MTDPTLRTKGGTGFAINQDRESRCRNASMNEADEVPMKPLATKSSLDKIPFKTVKGLSKV